MSQDREIFSRRLVLRYNQEHAIPNKGTNKAMVRVLKAPASPSPAKTAHFWGSLYGDYLKA